MAENTAGRGLGIGNEMSQTQTLTPGPLRPIGLIGGMSYHSTVDYYMAINDQVAAARGGFSSAPILLSSVDFAVIRAFQEAGDWAGAGRELAGHAVRLERAGAQAVMICTNLMHKVAPAVQAAVKAPLLHMLDAVAGAARDRGVDRLGIMGARWTMTEPFYADGLRQRGVEPVRADDADVALTDQIIFQELTLGRVTNSSRQALLGVVDRLVRAGARGVVLGCTELPLILKPGDAEVPLLDSTAAHAALAARFVLGGGPNPAPPPPARSRE
ncbi:MAG: amino acid racemase [Bifidobacteriaceae bacterium]|nr:amino acid racemase [Bifidobacteriaceae bacterium]